MHGQGCAAVDCFANRIRSFAVGKLRVVIAPTLDLASSGSHCAGLTLRNGRF